MRYVYLLKHKRKIQLVNNEWIYDTKNIGIYSSRQKAEETIKRYKYIEGFKDYPEDFVVEKYEIDFDDFDFN